MKELVAGFFLLVGGFWGLVIGLIFANNLISTINNNAEFLLSNIFEAQLLIQFAIATVLIVVGMVIARN